MLHEVKLTGLPTTSTTVFYQLGADPEWSAVLNFTANPSVAGGNTCVCRSWVLPNPGCPPTAAHTSPEVVPARGGAR